MIPDIERYKSIICLDGELPVEFLKKISLPILAADGAANTLIHNGITPNVIIGDLDSLNHDIVRNIRIVKDFDQNSTDFEKIIEYCFQQNLSPSIITGISGGYLDRIFMNLCIFAQTDSLLYSTDLIAFSKTEKFSLDLPYDTKISLFGAPECIVTTSGLKWNLNNSNLIFGKFSSCSNRVAQSRIDIKVQGTVLIFIYLKRVIDRGSN